MNRILMNIASVCSIFFILEIVDAQYLLEQEYSGGWIWQYPKPQGNPLLDIHAFDESNIIAVGSGGTIIRSSDGGDNWIVNTLSPFIAPALHSVFFITSETGWIVGSGGTIMKSIDEGKSWQLQMSPSNMDFYSVYFIDEHTGWIVGGRDTGQSQRIILKTGNGGFDWDVILFENGPILRDVFFRDDSTGWIVGNRDLLMKTIDGGLNWEYIPLRAEPYLYEDDWYSVRFADSDTGWVCGTKGKILKTYDGGISWEWKYGELFSSDTFHKLHFLGSSIGWAFGKTYSSSPYNKALIVYTQDGGETWYEQNAGNAYLLSSGVMLNESVGWGVGQFGTILKTENGGTEWYDKRYGSEIPMFHVYFLNENVGWIRGLESTLKTYDGGDHWEIVDDGIILNVISFVNDQVGWSFLHKTIYRTIDGGEQWDSVFTFDSGLLIEKLFFADELTGYGVGYGGSIVKTADGGYSWEDLSNSSYPHLYSAYFVDVETGWAVGDNGKIIKTNDGGKSWESQLSGIDDRLVDIQFINRNTGWILSENGRLLHSVNEGLTWDVLYSHEVGMSRLIFIDENNGFVLPWSAREIFKTNDGGISWMGEFIGVSSPIRSMFFTSKDRGWVVGGSGIILHTSTGGVVSVDQPAGIYENIPGDITLGQNFPNPFNPTTNIGFYLPQGGSVHLSVYNTLGQHITTLVDEELHEGNHIVTWNASHYPSGTYFYRLYTGNSMQTKKLLLIR
jgi:photosystem II stability/assembly factor-like uncharacterized protein